MLASRRKGASPIIMKTGCSHAGTERFGCARSSRTPSPAASTSYFASAAPGASSLGTTCCSGAVLRTREQLLALVTPASVLEVAEIEPEIIQQLGSTVASTASTHRDQRPAYIPFLISTPGCLWAHRCRSIFLRSCTAFTLGGLVIDPTQFPAGGAAGTAQRAAA